MVLRIVECYSNIQASRNTLRTTFDSPRAAMAQEIRFNNFGVPYVVRLVFASSDGDSILHNISELQ